MGRGKNLPKNPLQKAVLKKMIDKDLIAAVVAERMGITRAAFQMMLVRGRPRIDVLRRLAKAIEVPPEELLPYCTNFSEK